MSLANAIAKAKTAAASFIANNPAPHTYPCGFAWVEFKCRKNAREAKELIAAGARWSDYAKAYSISINTPTQSMFYNEAACDAFVASMIEQGFTGFHRRSRID